MMGMPPPMMGVPPMMGPPPLQPLGAPGGLRPPGGTPQDLGNGHDWQGARTTTVEVRPRLSAVFILGSPGS